MKITTNCVFLSCSVMYKSSNRPILEKELDLNKDPTPLILEQHG